MLRLLSALFIATLLLNGCGSNEPPAPEPEKIEQEMQQLNENRQREWNNQ